MKSIGRRIASSGRNLRAQNQKARAREQLRRAVVETLEQRQYLTITPSISGSPTIDEGSSYPLTLTYSGSAPVAWKIDWGDGNLQTLPDANDPVLSNGMTVDHTYANGPNNYKIAAEAIDSSGQSYVATTTVPASWNLDAAFGSGGTLSVALPSGFTYKTSAVQSDGKLLVAGTFNGHFGLARYLTNGSLDSSFNATGAVSQIPGVVEANFGAATGATTTDVPSAMLVQTTGEIDIAGRSTPSFQSPSFAIARFMSNGSPDPHFGANGLVTSDISDANITALAQQLDGSIVAAGISGNQLAVARYNDYSGGLDPSFGPDTTGWITIGLGTTVNFVNATAVEWQDGKIIVGGQANSLTDSTRRLALVRIDEDGINQDDPNDPSPLDTTFGTDGTGIVLGNANETVTSLMLNPPHGATPQILVTSKSTLSGASGDFFLYRYNNDGTLDTTFNSTGPNPGEVTTDFNNGSNDISNYVLLQGSKIIVTGSSATASNTNFAIARYNTNGTRDSTFGPNGNGTITTYLNGTDIASGVFLETDGTLAAV